MQYQGFIDRMQQKFLELYSQRYGPPGMQMQETPVAARYTGAGTDGRVQPSQPAGVVHEGEMVVEQPMVEQAGGPENVRYALEGLAKKLPGYQTGTGDSTVKAPPTEGEPVRPSIISSSSSPAKSSLFQMKDTLSKLTPPTEGEPVRPDIISSSPAKTSLFQMKDKLSNILTGPGVASEGAPAAPKPIESYGTINPLTGKKTVTSDKSEFEKDMQSNALLNKMVDTQKFYEGMSKQGFAGLQDIASGESEAARLERLRATQSLSGEQAAERMALNQRLAQADASPEEAAAAMGRMGREERLAKTDLESRLAISGAERAEQATQKLAELGTEASIAEKNLLIEQQKLGFEEAKLDIQESLKDLEWAKLDEDKKMNDLAYEKFTEYLKLDMMELGLKQSDIESLIEARKQDWLQGWDKIKQNASQFGLEYALEKSKFDWDIKGPLFQAMIENGQIDGAQTILNDFGLGDIQLSAIADVVQRQAMTDATENLISLISLTPQIGIDDPQIQAELDRMAKALPTQPADINEWKKQKFDNLKIMTHPIYSQMAVLGDEGVESLAKSLGWEGTEGFAWNGLSGTQAVEAALTDLFITGGMMMTEEGMAPNMNSAWATLLAGPGGAATNNLPLTPANNLPLTPTNKTEEDVFNYIIDPPENVTFNFTGPGYSTQTDFVSEMQRQLTKYKEGASIFTEEQEKPLWNNIDAAFSELLGDDFHLGAYLTDEEFKDFMYGTREMWSDKNPNPKPKIGTPEQLAPLHFFSTFINNAGIDPMKAYELTANMVGKEKLDESIKIMTKGKSLEELIEDHKE